MVCISFSYREVRTELPPSPFISELHFQTDHCCRDLLRNSSPILWKQDGHPFLGPGELIKLVAVVQYTHTLLLISSMRCFSLLCCLWGRTSWVLIYSTVALVVNHSGLREAYKMHVVNSSCQTPSSVLVLWVCTWVKSVLFFVFFCISVFFIFNGNSTFPSLLVFNLQIYCKQIFFPASYLLHIQWWKMDSTLTTMYSITQLIFLIGLNIFVLQLNIIVFKMYILKHVYYLLAHSHCAHDALI